MSLGYYFGFFLPNQNLATEKLNRQIECQKMGTALYDKEFSETEGVLNPTFKFSSKHKTCLYKGGWVNKDAETGNIFLHEFIKDVYLNKNIVIYMQVTDDIGTKDLVVDGMVSRGNFKTQEKELFDE
jgi:hypothetical protein